MDRPTEAALPARVDHVVDWIFDLDNTLYPSTCELFAQIDKRMGEFIGHLLGLDRTEARQVQKQYFYQYGTTLRGLMVEHGLDPIDFLDYTHDIDLSPVVPSPELDSVLGRLEGRKLIFTNATARHARNVVGRLGIGHHFDRIFDIAAADYTPKPDPAAYRVMVRRCGITPRRAALFEDIARNLEPAAALGMTTVWVKPHHEWAGAGLETDDTHIHHVADDLVAWLRRLADARDAAPGRRP